MVKGRPVGVIFLLQHAGLVAGPYLLCHLSGMGLAFL